MKVRSAEKWSESAKKWCESAHNGEPSFSQQECLRQLRLALEKNLGRIEPTYETTTAALRRDVAQRWDGVTE